MIHGKCSHHRSTTDGNTTVTTGTTTVGPTTKPIGFHARISKTAGRRYQQHSPIVFDDVLYNAGDSYNGTDGNFIAPVSGLYVLFFSGLVGPASASSLSSNMAELMVDLVRLGLASSSYSSSRYQTASVQAVFWIRKDQQAWVQNWTKDVYWEYGHFSAALVRRA